MPLTAIKTSNLDTTNSLFFRNRIINGAMEIDQRNAGASATAGNNTYVTCDRWITQTSQSSKFSVQQNAGAVTPPPGFRNYLGVTTLASVSIGAADYFNVQQRIESNNMADLNWGTANAQNVTLSFWVRSSVTGTFGGAFLNESATRSYPFSYSISSANTWTKISVNVPGCQDGTWSTGNALGMFVNFALAVGSDTAGTVNIWNNAFDFGPTGAQSIFGAIGNTFYITGVQLEIGTAATAFEYRPFGTELALCQRYYQVIATGNAKGISMATYYTSTNLSGLINFAVTMRTDPTFSQVTGTNYYRGQGNGGTDEFNSFTADRASPQMLMWYNNSETSGTQGVGTVVYTNNNAAFLAVQAEL